MLHQRLLRESRLVAAKVLLSTILVPFGLVGCDETPPTLPGPPSPPPATTTVAPPPPPNRGPQFSYDNVRGVLRFPIVQDSPGDIRDLIATFRAAWPDKTLAINACSEVVDWNNTPWCDSDVPVFSGEHSENLRRFLQITADEGVMVRLNIFCTLRDNAGWMEANWKRYTRRVATISREFDHVLLSVANEPYHPNSWLRHGGRVRQVRDEARMAGFEGPMGADDTVSPRGNDFRYQYAGLGFIPDFHPFRNPDPGPSDFDRLIQENGRPLVISEPTAYSTTREGGCCTADRQQILSYFRRAERRGITMFYHTTHWGLECRDSGGDPWIPRP